LLAFFFLGTPCTLVRAVIEAPGAANLSLEVIKEYRSKGVPDDKWPPIMETMGNGENTASSGSSIKTTCGSARLTAC
jgi:hypothetical protein